MRRFVNGEEAELHRTAVEVHLFGDRLMVKTSEGSFSALAIRHDSAILVSFKGKQYRVEERRSRSTAAVALGSGELHAPMPGQIVDVRRAAGELVQKGDTIIVLEAMKTQQPFLAPYDGRIKQISVKTGDQVKDGDLMAIVEAAGQSDV